MDGVLLALAVFVLFGVCWIVAVACFMAVGRWIRGGR